MIKMIISTTIYTIIIAALALPLGAFLGLVDFNDFAPFVLLAADLVEPFVVTFDLLLTTFPLTLLFVLYFSILGIMRLVVVRYAKE